jgi:hypothetical protein
VVKGLTVRKEKVFKRCLRRRIRRRALVVKYTFRRLEVNQSWNRHDILNPGNRRREIKLGDFMRHKGNDKSLAWRQDGIKQIGKE